MNLRLCYRNCHMAFSLTTKDLFSQWYSLRTALYNSNVLKKDRSPPDPRCYAPPGTGRHVAAQLPEHLPHLPCASWLFSKRKKKTQYNIKGFSNIPNLDKLKIYNFNAKSLWPVLSQNFYYKNHYTTWINDDNENNLWVSNIFRTYKYFNIFSL